MATTQTLLTQLRTLSEFDPGPYPVLSLYLNLQPDATGRDNFAAFVRGDLQARIGSYPQDSPEYASLQGDADRITDYLPHIDRSLNGLAVFASSAAGLFEAIPLAAPVTGHSLHISRQAHLYPLARLLDEFPRYAVVVADRHAARLFVVAANEIAQETDIVGVKTKHHKMGGWSQSRFQRHVENFHQQHAKEVVAALSRLVRDERIPSIVIGGDEPMVAMLKSEMAKDVAERVIDTVRLDVRAAETRILQASLDAVQRQDVKTDQEQVDALLDAYRSGGLGTVGVPGVKRALELGQVDQLVLTAAADSALEQQLEALVVQAIQTSASVRFIQDQELLKPFGHVGAFLRFTLDARTSGDRSEQAQ